MKKSSIITLFILCLFLFQSNTAKAEYTFSNDIINEKNKESNFLLNKEKTEPKLKIKKEKNIKIEMKKKQIEKPKELSKTDFLYERQYKNSKIYD